MANNQRWLGIQRLQANPAGSAGGNRRQRQNTCQTDGQECYP
jgi:hypothetical protein